MMGRGPGVVQLHLGATSSDASVLVPGEAETWVRFPVQRGLLALREALEQLPEGAGLVLVGEVVVDEPRR